MNLGRKEELRTILGKSTTVVPTDYALELLTALDEVEGRAEDNSSLQGQIDDLEAERDARSEEGSTSGAKLEFIDGVCEAVWGGECGWEKTGLQALLSEVRKRLTKPSDAEQELEQLKSWLERKLYSEERKFGSLNLSEAYKNYIVRQVVAEITQRLEHLRAEAT